MVKGVDALLVQLEFAANVKVTTTFHVTGLELFPKATGVPVIRPVAN
jgi:hypothetical protein